MSITDSNTTTAATTATITTNTTLAPHDEHRALSIVGILGMIGVGKTTLLENAAKKANLPVFKEYVVQSILRDFIQKKPWMNAFSFQAVMMQSACARLENALSLARARLSPLGAGLPLANSSGEITNTDAACTHSSFTLLAHNLKEGRIVLHERPPVENRIFALANRTTGAMTKQEHILYTEYVDEMLVLAKESGVPNLNVVLWAPSKKTLANMRLRGTESEQDYDEDFYLACLHHVYFLDILAHEKEHGYVVVDWSNYGTFDSLSKVLNKVIDNNREGRLPTIVEHTNHAVDWGTLESILPYNKEGQDYSEKEEFVYNVCSDDYMRKTTTNSKVPTSINHILGRETCSKSKDGVGATAGGRSVHLHMGRYLESDRATRARIQHIVLSNMAHTWQDGPNIARLYVHDMADRHRLHDPSGRYAKDTTYQKEKEEKENNDHILRFLEIQGEGPREAKYSWLTPNTTPVFVFIVCLAIVLVNMYQKSWIAIFSYIIIGISCLSFFSIF